MCSQVLYGRRRLCQDCEWEIEAAQLAAAPDPDTGPRGSVEDDAPPQSVPSADGMQPDASVSFNMWRTRRGARSTGLALVAALALAAAAGLHPGQLPARASTSVMYRVDAAAPGARTGRSGAAAGAQTATGAAPRAAIAR
jgi:hypothetical protein